MNNFKYLFNTYICITNYDKKENSTANNFPCLIRQNLSEQFSSSVQEEGYERCVTKTISALKGIKEVKCFLS